MANRRLLAAVLAVVLAAGCGVRGSTGVTVAGPGTERGPRSVPGSGERVAPPPGPADAASPEELVAFFLQAAAGEFESAPERLKRFLAPGTTWQPEGRPVTIVRVGDTALETTADTTTVKVTLRPVGKLNADGSVVPVTDTSPRPVPFTVVNGVAAGGGSRVLVNPPDGVIYLDSRTLTSFYLPHSIYFWDRVTSALVPDLRYRPLTVAVPKRAGMIVGWVLNGPSPWLQTAVADLPNDIKPKDDVVVSGDQLVVNLNAQATGQDFRRLVSQLRWSLRDVHNGPVILQVDGQQKAESRGNDHINDNWAASASLRESKPYCVVGGQIGDVDFKQQAYPVCDLTKPRPAALTQAINSGVVTGAITANGSRAALVRRETDGRDRLTVSQAPERGDQEVAVSAPVGPSGPIGRPAWLTSTAGSPARGLVPINGELYEFAVGSGVLRRVQTEGRTGITAVTVAPDGRRVALVAGGRVYLATVEVGSAERVVTLEVSTAPLPSSVGVAVGVGWSQPDRVVVGGDGDLVAEITVDGAVEDVFGVVLKGLTISRLVAFPTGPTERRAPGQMMMEASGKAYAVYVTTNQLIQPVTPGQPPVTAVFFAE